MGIKLSLIVATPEVEDWPFDLLAEDFETKIRQAAELGYDGVELLSRDFGQVDQAEVRRVLDRYGLEVPALVTGALYGLEGLCLMSPDQSIQQRAVEQLKRFLEFAGAYGAVVDIGLLRGRLKEMPEPARAQEELAHTFRQAAEYAAGCGARVTLEPINRYESDFIYNAQDGLDWVDRVDHPNFGLMLDTFHMNIEDASIEDSIRQAGDKLWHMHVADSNRLSPGRGHFDFVGMVQTLKEIGYNGYLSAEHLAQPDPVSAAAETARYLRQIL
jgi:sugar phosphate isomerase/epimerase